MAGERLQSLLDRNRNHTDALSADYFADVQEIQSPPVVAVCCSDSRVSQEGMFDVTVAGYLFTPSNIGNQVRDEYDGEIVVDGSLMYPVLHTETDTIAIVGHTQCGAVTAAYRAAVGEGEPWHPGIRERVEKLVPIVGDGLESDRVDADADDAAVIDQLVEYNVDRQIEFLLENADLDDDVSVYGFVYDFHGTFGDVKGRTYVVNAGGETNPAEIRSRLPDKYEEFVRSQLDSS